MNKRHYTHCNIQLRVETVDALKIWNAEKPTIRQDKKFLRLLVLDIFGTKLLMSSSMGRLDARKIRFARG